MTVDEQIKKAMENKVYKVHQNLVRETAVRSYGNIIMSTPVDEGTARGNWNISVNLIDTTVTDSTEIPDLNPPIEYKSGTIYISNFLPYIARLNDGYSKQAPANFVEKGIELGIRQAKRGRL